MDRSSPRDPAGQEQPSGALPQWVQRQREQQAAPQGPIPWAAPVRQPPVASPLPPAPRPLAEPENSRRFSRGVVFAAAGAASLMLVVAIGLLAVLKRDEERLAQLEAKLTAKPAGAADTAATSDHPAITREMKPEPSPQLKSEPQPAAAAKPAGEPIPAAEEEKTFEPSPPAATAVAPPPTDSGHETASADPAKPASVGDKSPSADDAYRLASIDPASTAVGVAEKSWFAHVGAGELPSAEQPAVCAADRSLGTSMTWCKSPQEAEVKAREQGKLVFLIHVSGNFEDPGFT